MQVKENWEINVEDGNVVIYLHQVNNNPDIIKTAVSIIDAQQKFYDSQKINGETELAISKEQLDRIFHEFRNFTAKKMGIIKELEEHNKSVTKALRELILSELDTYCQGFYQHTADVGFNCDYCGKSWTSKKALAGHHKGCVGKKAKEAKENGTSGPVITIDP